MYHVYLQDGREIHIQADTFSETASPTHLIFYHRDSISGELLPAAYVPINHITLVTDHNAVIVTGTLAKEERRRIRQEEDQVGQSMGENPSQVGHTQAQARARAVGLAPVGRL